MFRFYSIVDDITFEKIKNGTKTVKFYLCDNKRAGLSVNDKIVLLNNGNEKLNIIVTSIKKSKNLETLIKQFSLDELGETDYNSAYFNVKKWFLDSDIEKYSIMAVTVEIIHE